ncbi:hypothetical protein [Haloarcula sp. Atlit-47R]|uniref:hypothetical protein n=1 Tax=Haloarcula sp. Atlit-47R TaxID=2282132 RepID=UPI000EF1F90F|nr:hypothetical protein [Haloarcula sp. Atlit-47R]
MFDQVRVRVVDTENRPLAAADWVIPEGLGIPARVNSDGIAQLYLLSKGYNEFFVVTKEVVQGDAELTWYSSIDEQETIAPMSSDTGKVVIDAETPSGGGYNASTGGISMGGSPFRSPKQATKIIAAGAVEPMPWRGKQDWDNAISSTGLGHPDSDLTVSQEQTDVVESFEDGVEMWSGGSFNRATDRAYTGDASLKVENGTPSMSWEGGPKPDTIEWYWQESSSGSYGGGVRFKNSNGQYELGNATNNPEWMLSDGDNLTQIYNGDGYNRWVRTTLTFNWQNGQYDVEMEDMTSGHVETRADQPLKNGVDIDTVEVWEYSGGWTTGGAINMWFDDLTYQSLSQNGTLVTQTKSFNGEYQPDLVADVELNGGSVDVTVVGTPDVAANEKATVSLEQGESEYYVDHFYYHTDFRLEISIERAADGSTPVIHSLKLV